MININDKNGICIEITGNKITNSMKIADIIEKMAESDDMLADAIILGVAKVKDKKYIMKQVDKAVWAKGKTEELFNDGDLKKILDKIDEFFSKGDKNE